MKKDPNFYKTPMGKKYYKHDLPRLIESQNRLAEAIEKQNKLNEKKLRSDQKHKVDPTTRPSKLY